MPNTEFDAFTRFVDRVLSVPHSIIKEREAEYRKQSLQNPRRRGPKPKGKAVKSSVSPGPADHA